MVLIFFRFAWLSLSLLDIGDTHFRRHPQTNQKIVFFFNFWKTIHLCELSEDEFSSSISFSAALFVVSINALKSGKPRVCKLWSDLWRWIYGIISLLSFFPRFCLIGNPPQHFCMSIGSAPWNLNTNKKMVFSVYSSSRCGSRIKVYQWKSSSRFG